MEKSELWKRLTESIDRTERLQALTNREISDLLLERIWAEMNIFTPESDLLDEAICRIDPERRLQ